MTIRLVTDSTCDLSPALQEKYDVRIVPINIQFGEESFQENLTIDPDTFYRRIRETGEFPNTSQPSVGQFAAMYRALTMEADEVISIHVTAKLSGTYQSAKLAQPMVADDIAVHVIDSQAGSAGMGWMLVQAGDMIEAGYSTADIIATLKASRAEISVFFAVDNIKFAQLSGRVNRLTGTLVSLLNIKPIIGLENGLIEMRDRTRSNKAALRKIVELTQKQVQDRAVNVGIVHAQAPERANTLLGLARQNLNVQQVFVKDVALSLAVHFGPGTVGLVTYPARPAVKRAA